MNNESALQEQVYKIFGVNEEMIDSVNHEGQWDEFKRNNMDEPILFMVDGKEYIGGVDLANGPDKTVYSGGFGQ